MLRSLSLLLLLPVLLTACQEPETELVAVQPSSEGLPQLHLEIIGPWELSATPAPDGGLWVASFSHTNNAVAVWLVTGQRSARLLDRVETGHHPDDIHWIDWNKDGLINEFLLTVEGEKTIELWQLDDEKLERINSRTVSIPPRTIAVADLDQDQTTDIILGPYQGEAVTILWGDVYDDEIAEQYLQSMPSPTYPKIVDWNKDNLPDIIWSEWAAEGVIALAKNLGGRDFEIIALTPPLPNAPRQVTVADVDNDGFPDVLIGLEAGKKAYIFYSDGEGKIARGDEIAAPLAGYSEIAVGRIDGDIMLALAETHVIVFARRGENGRWITRQIPASSAASLQFFDADNDDHQDLAFVTHTGVHIVYGPLWENATAVDL